MPTGERTPVTLEGVETTRWLQTRAIEAYLTVAATLKAGMTEAQIAEAVKGELKTKGVADFWYDIPIMVLIGPGRFRAMASLDYRVKSPSEVIILNEGSPFFIDMHPRAKNGRWGNFAATGLYRPRDSDTEVKDFLREMQRIQFEGIDYLTPTMVGSDVSAWFENEFADHDINLVDVRGNFGHSMGSGPKTSHDRLFLDSENHIPIGGQIFGIEPGGFRDRSSGGRVVARFEDCVHIPNDDGQPEILGRDVPVRVIFENR